MVQVHGVEENYMSIQTNISFENINLSCDKGLWSVKIQERIEINDLVLSILTEKELLSSVDEECTCIIVGAKITFCFPNLTACIEIQKADSQSLVYDCTITNTSELEQRIISITPTSYQGDWFADGFFVMSKETKVLTCPAERCYGYDGAKDVSNSNAIPVSYTHLRAH